MILMTSQSQTRMAMMATTQMMIIEEIKQEVNQMAEIVAKLGIKREVGYLYYLSKSGDLCRVKMSRTGRRKGARNK